MNSRPGAGPDMAGTTTFTKARRELFLETLRATGNVSESALVAGISRSRVYQVRAQSQPFADAWDDAVSAVEDRIEAEAIRRAVDGVEEPYYYQGKECGTVRKYSDPLLMFLLKTRCPERYGDKPAPVEGTAAEPVVFELNFAGAPEKDTESGAGSGIDETL